MACALVFVLFSCSTKKEAGQTTNSEQSALPPGVNAEAWFGHMYVDGCAQRMKGNLQEALRLFNECVRVQPQNPAVHYELGTIHKLLGNSSEALRYARFSALSVPSNEWYQLLYIACLQAEGEFGQAIRSRENLVKKYPARSDFKEDLAIDYAMTGQFDKSVKVYEELEKEYGINEQITLNKVKLLKSQKKFSDVEKELIRLSESNKSEVQYYAYLAEFYLEQNALEKARVMYDRILELDPSNPTVHLALHDYYQQKGKRDEAYGHLTKAFLNPELDVQTKTGIIGSFYKGAAEEGSGEAAKQGKELVEIMLKVHPKAPEPNALYADFLLLDNKKKEAAAYYYKASLYERNDVRVWENLLFVENELGLNDSVQKHSNQAMELFPNQPRSYLYNGVANMQLREYEKATRSLRDGLEFAVNNKALRLDLLRLLGDAYHRLKEHSKSDAAFEEALKIDPDNAYVLNNYAYYMSLRDHNLEHAAALSRQSLNIDATNRNYMDTYGWILFRQKKYADAEEWLRRAAGGASPSAVILEHHGDALYMMGRKSQALERWKAAQRAGGSSEVLIRKIKEEKINDQ